MTAAPTSIALFSVDRVREQFPILSDTSAGPKTVVYLDNGATTQKPVAVIEAIDRYYRHTNANIHRAVHRLSQAATEAFEATRVKVQRFINARAREEVIFTRGTTESINLVAHSCSRLAREPWKPGDEILITALEHHSNIVPWQLIAQERGMTIKVLPIDRRGEPLYEKLPGLLSSRTKMVAITHTSNALGTVVDVKRIVAAAKSVGAKVLIDGAQWVGHWPLDVQELECDFYAFSAHKLYGPTGVGVLWGRRELLDAMPPYQAGGDMIKVVSLKTGTTFADLPNKFEAGTPDIAGVVGLGAAINWLNSIDRAGAAIHEHALLEHATKRLSSIKGVRLIGTAPKKASIVSFLVEDSDLTPHDVGILLDQDDIAVRTGHHCCMPLMDEFEIPGTVRASISMYNTKQDIDALCDAVERISASHVGRPKIATKSRNSELVFPTATADSVEAAAAEMAETIAAEVELGGSAIAYLQEQSSRASYFPEALKSPENEVKGCQATVFFSGRRVPDSRDRIEFVGWSDGLFQKGLIVVLQQLFSGQRGIDILAFDWEAFLSKVGLQNQITVARRNGLAAMMSRIRRLAGLASEIADAGKAVSA